MPSSPPPRGLTVAMKQTLAERIPLKLPHHIFPGWWVVAACATIGAYGGGVYFYGFTIFFNPLKEELGLSSAQTSLVFSLTRLEGAFEGAVVGFLIDRFGARRIMIIGVPIAGVGYLLWASIVDSYLTFILVYVGAIAIGINAGFFHPALAVTNNWFIRRRATAMAIISVSVGVGGSILVPLLGLIIANWGWKTAAALSGAGLLLLIWPLTLLIRHSPEQMGLRPDGDPPAAQEEPALEKDMGHGPTAHGVQQGVASTVRDVEYTVTQAFRTRAMWLLIGAITLRFAAHTAIMVHLAPIMEDRGMSPVAAGGAIGLLVFLSIPARLAVGWLGDRFAKHKVVASLLVLQVLAMLVLLAANSIWQLYLFIVLWAAAYGAGILNWAIVGDYFGRARFATLRGLMGLVYSGGAVVGPVYAGWVHDTTGAYTTAILAFVVVTGAAMLLYWFCSPPGLNP